MSCCEHCKSIGGRTGFSLIGILISMACMVVLSMLLLRSLNVATTGAGSTLPNTARSVEDQMTLKQIHVLMLENQDGRDRLPAPSELDRRLSIEDNTTASLWSMVLARNPGLLPKMLISANEHNPWVLEDTDYDREAYNPAAGVFWDRNFKADLADDSNVSYAHMVLYGRRFEKHWNSFGSSTTPLFGSRGPKDGKDDPGSYTYGRNGAWAGHIVFADDHVEYLQTFTPPGVIMQLDGTTYSDNIFAMDDEPAGEDAILTFTQRMNADGPVMQFD